MATTTNYSFTLPTVGGSENEWGTNLNANWTALDALLGGVTNAEFSILDGATVTTAELNVLDGVIVSTTEINYLDGATSNLQSQINDLAAVAGNVPSGGIIMWSGAVGSIPSGWFLCDGNNSTPDLRDRFVVGAGSTYAVGATGGAASVALSSSEMPAHSHTFSGSTNTAGAHTHEVAAGNTGGTENIIVTGNTRQTDTNFATTSAGSHSHSFSGTTSTTGSGSAHENRPPYYALAYIMKA